MSEEPTFRDLMSRVRAGDEQAAEELVRLYVPAIRLVVRRRLHDPSLRSLFESMDICQSILAGFFVRVALGQYELDTEEQLRKLLVTMALNKLRNHKQSQEAARRDARRTQKDSSAVREVVDPYPSPGQLAANRELLQALRSRLSEEERQLVELREQECSWAEIAERVGSKPDTVRMRYHRAIDRVLDELGLRE